MGDSDDVLSYFLPPPRPPPPTRKLNLYNGLF